MCALNTLLVIAPIALLVSYCWPDIQCGPIFALGVAWATARFDWRGGLPVALASIPVQSLLCEQPRFELTGGTHFQFQLIVCLVLISLTKLGTRGWKVFVLPHARRVLVWGRNLRRWEV